ncbi:hypothetical protein Bca101_091834 [Brassica carinata]
MLLLVAVYRPEGDDSCWFCSRVGCDQKHEEFMDSEAIYKRFVLRVMAARSLSVLLILNAPTPAPAKPSRSRVSRLAMISSLPHKANGGNLRPRELKAVPTNKNATPKSSVPHKRMDKKTPAGFRSVQNPRTATTRELENRVVAAKALVFHSPKKLVKLKRYVELSSSVKKLCNGMMRKLETGNKRNVTLTPSKKSLRRAKEKEQHVLSSNPSKVYEANNGMELENQSGSSEKTSGDEEFLVKNKSEELSETLKTNYIDDQLQAGEEDPAVIKQHHIGGKENASPWECDDQEEMVTNADEEAMINKILQPWRVTGKSTEQQATTSVMTIVDNCFNGKTVSATSRVKYTKPKLTNPKPFRLRTDERRILKESNMEKKPPTFLASMVKYWVQNMSQLESKSLRGTSTTTLVRHDASEDMVNCKRVA